MKRIYIIISFILIATGVSAQVGFEGGVNLANMTVKILGANIPSNYAPLLAFGVAFDTKINDHFFFQPAIMYQGEGCVLTQAGNAPEEILVLNTAAVHINFEYKTGERCGRRFFFGLGPFIAFSLNKSDNTSNLLYKGTDIGPAINLGYQTKRHLYYRAGYQMGLVNVLEGGDSNNSLTTSAITITVGYLLGGCHPPRRFLGARQHNGNHWRGLPKNGPHRKERIYRDRFLKY